MTFPAGPVGGGQATYVPGEPVVLDEASVEIARRAARAPLLARWPTAVVIVVGPILWDIVTSNAGQVGPLSNSAVDTVVFMYTFCGLPFVIVPWFVAFIVFRYRAMYLRKAIQLRRAWLIQGEVQPMGLWTISVAGRLLRTIHLARIPSWAQGQRCVVVFADANVGSGVDGGFSMRGAVIRIDGPGGRTVYPATGAIPDLLRAPVVIASAAVAFGFTAACNAQSQAYGDASARLHDIQAATQCTEASRPGDDCWKWVPGTLTWGGGYSESPDSSACPVTLKWASGTQDGDIRANGAHCSQQLSAEGPMQVSIRLIKNFAVEVRVGETVYQTDRWPPNGTVLGALEWIFRIAALLWLAWPIFHVGSAILYRVRRVTSARRAAIPSPPAPAPGSTL